MLVVVSIFFLFYLFPEANTPYSPGFISFSPCTSEYFQKCTLRPSYCFSESSMYTIKLKIFFPFFTKAVKKGRGDNLEYINRCFTLKLSLKEAYSVARPIQEKLLLFWYANIDKIHDSVLLRIQTKKKTCQSQEDCEDQDRYKI